MKIDKGIEAPIDRTRSNAKRIIAMQMEIGDSVLFDSSSLAESFAVTMRNAKLKPTMRQVQGGVRVWRTA